MVFVQPPACRDGSGAAAAAQLTTPQPAWPSRSQEGFVIKEGSVFSGAWVGSLEVPSFYAILDQDLPRKQRKPTVAPRLTARGCAQVSCV